MSHIVRIVTRIKDPVALSEACKRLGLEPPVHGKTTVYAAEVSGQIVKLPGWAYPAVVDTATGDISYDNYGGAWGNQRELDRLLQAYGVEKARIEARRNGHSVTEQALADGSIKLTIQIGGAA